MKSQRSAGGASLATFAAALLVGSTASAQPVQYYGGRVISNVEIVEVSWTNTVDPTYLAKLAGFYTAIVKSPFIDWMTEYDTIGKIGFADMLPGTNQHIGRGTFGGSFVITPANVKKSLLDVEVQIELDAQITSGALPPPKLDAGGNVNTLYMVDFPPGYDINILGAHSCQQYGAYHFSFTRAGKSVPYGVHPGCGYQFNASTVVHSHELAEAITDMEQGAANQNTAPTRPVAWMTAAQTTYDALETADICQGASFMVAGYTVQGIWSNFAKGCVAQIPICDGVLMQPKCRPCSPFDSGSACGGTKPVCATAGAEAGQCVACTSASPAACTGATPLCDDATNTCVGCFTSADCKAPSAPVCNAPTKACRACAADAECAKGVCDLLGDTQQGQCVTCNADKDCSASERCDSHACVPQTPPDGGSSGQGGNSGSGNGSGSGSGSGGGGGQAGPGEQAGCGCRTAPRPEGEAAGWLVVGLFATASARRRRARGA